jgi:probable phosphoglycerate mutase
MQRITLIRHGESTWNAAKRWQGHSDPPLTIAGRHQARALERRLAPLLARADRVESSDLKRVTTTAELAGAAPLERPGWRELYLGDWEGLYHHEVEARFGDQLRALRHGEPVKLGGGESWFDLRDRAGAELKRLCDDLPPDGQGVVFCHGGVILALVSAAFDLPESLPRRVGRLVNTSVTELGIEADGTTVLLRYNDASHLLDREPRARHGVRVARLVVGADAEHAWPPTAEPADPIDIEGTGDVLRGYAHEIIGTGGRARLGPLTTEAHVQVRENALILVDYNLNARRHL